MKKIYIVIVLVLLTNVTLAGGGWPQPKGNGFFKFSQFMITAKGLYNGNGEVSDLPFRTGFLSTGFYGEYGVTDKVTLMLNAPFYVNTFVDGEKFPDGTISSPEEVLSGIGDFDIGVKYGIINNQKINVAATLYLGLPTGKVGSLLSTGDGEFNQLLLVDVSKSWSIKKVNIYATATGGFNKRSNNNSNEVRYGGEVGVGIWKLWYIARLNAVKSLNNFPDENAEAQPGIFANNIEFVSLAHEVALNITDKFGASVSYAGAFSAKKILAAPSYTFGVYYNLRK